LCVCVCVCVAPHLCTESLLAYVVSASSVDCRNCEISSLLLLYPAGGDERGGGSGLWYTLCCVGWCVYAGVCMHVLCVLLTNELGLWYTLYVCVCRYVCTLCAVVVERAGGSGLWYTLCCVGCVCVCEYGVGVCAGALCVCVCVLCVCVLSGSV
jgi:hypothetical protein